MFRAEIHELEDGPTLKMEGRLVGQWAEQAKSLVTMNSVPKGLIIDLTDVTYVDSVGEQALIWFSSIGAAFVGKGVYAAGVCERLRLPLHGFEGTFTGPRPARPGRVEAYPAAVLRKRTCVGSTRA
jgi:hypothetical protein